MVINVSLWLLYVPRTIFIRAKSCLLTTVRDCSLGILSVINYGGNRYLLRLRRELCTNILEQAKIQVKKYKIASPFFFGRTCFMLHGLSGHLRWLGASCLFVETV